MKLIKKISIILSLVFVLTLITNGISVLQTVKTAEASTISISKKTATITPGDTLQLRVNGTKSKITWTSSKKSIATVNSKGLVTAIKEGTATITATVNKKKYTCKLTVEAKEFTDKDMIAFGWILLRDSLKNPDSLKIYSIKIGYEDAEYGDGMIIKGQKNVLFDYSAQNGYGGTNREYATVNFYPFDEEPYSFYITSGAYDGYLVLSHYSNHAPDLYDTTKYKVKDIQPLVDKYLDEENFECY